MKVSSAYFNSNSQCFPEVLMADQFYAAEKKNADDDQVDVMIYSVR